jgi:hypothetical protein
MTNLTEISTAAVLFLLVLAVVAFFWLWSQRNTKATEERIKKYQMPLEVDSPPGVGGGEMPPPEVSRDLADDLDGRIATLQRLLGAADEQAARLERAIEQAKQIRP